MYLIYLKVRVTMRSRDRKKSFMYWFTPLVPGLSVVRKGKVGTESFNQCSTQVTGAQVFGQNFTLLFLAHVAGSRTGHGATGTGTDTPRDGTTTGSSINPAQNVILAILPTEDIPDTWHNVKEPPTTSCQSEISQGQKGQTLSESTNMSTWRSQIRRHRKNRCCSLGLERGQMKICDFMSSEFHLGKMGKCCRLRVWLVGQQGEQVQITDLSVKNGDGKCYAYTMRERERWGM